MLIALTQIDQKWEDKEENLLTCKSLISEVKESGVDLVIFPEMTLTGFSMNYEAIAEESDTLPTLDKFRRLALEYEMAMIFGMAIRSESGGTNTSIYLSREGKVLGKYNKIHPFSAAGEDEIILPGESLCIVDNGGLRIGMTICYDLRFPEIFSAASNNCDLIVNIANWPAKRIEHWNCLLKARAIENQLYIAGVNRIGIDANSIKYEKSSILINPNGDQVDALVEKENFLIYEVNESLVNVFRRSFSTTQDRRPNLYKSML
jgi:omega-amidase